MDPDCRSGSVVFTGSVMVSDRGNTVACFLVGGGASVFYRTEAAACSVITFDRGGAGTCRFGSGSFFVRSVLRSAA